MTKDPDLKDLSDKGSNTPDKQLYFVEWCVNPYAEEIQNIHYFTHLDSAHNFSDRKQKSFKGVWFGKNIKRRTPTGKEKNDLYYTWWSPSVVANPDWGDIPEPGYGFLMGTSKIVYVG